MASELTTNCGSLEGYKEGYNQALEDVLNKHLKFDKDICYINHKGEIDFNMIRFDIVEKIKESEVAEDE